MINYIENIYITLATQIAEFIYHLWPKIVWALFIIIIWALTSYLIYKASYYVFKKIWLNELVDKLKVDPDIKKDEVKKEWRIKKLSKYADKIKVDVIVSKSISYYIFILFFRIAISFMWITEVEAFLKDLINYLPSLFIWIAIWFFGIRFANFIYDVVYHTLKLTKQSTSKIIATWSKIIILFFTLMLVLDYTKIVSEFIINTILIWFVWMLMLAWWIAFGLWWKDVAHDILESFRK